MRIDLNCDLGEGCGDDAAIVPWISSASIACGGHAGDEATMRATLALCRAHGVAAGAHPGYPDREHFGRRELDLSPGALRETLLAQMARLRAVADAEGVRLAHVKPHGALYNRAARDAGVAAVVVEAVRAFDPALTLYALSGSLLAETAAHAGLRVAHEAFVERGYGADGHLLPRGTPGAVLDTVDAAVAQARALLRGALRARDGTKLAIRADTLCLHGDRPDAAAFARALREALGNDGVAVLPFGASA
jgi:UPF0271 protein